jgi:ABC-type lipoprotein release transport system permease subunit
MKLFRRLWFLARRRHEDDDVAEELEYHRAMAQARLEQDGLPAHDAAAASRRAGVFAYVVQQRTHEIGVRVALGAPVADIVGVVVRSSLLAIGGGAIVGMVGAFLASGLLRSYLLGLSPVDPAAHLGVLLVLTAAGAVATLLPARNAARIEPVNALRHDA